MRNLNYSLDIPSLHNSYRTNALTPEKVIDDILALSKEFQHHNIWIHQLSKAEISPYLARLDPKSIDDYPLYGIPFAIKDNIDLANIPTTAACQDFAYLADHHAHIVEQLIAAGAIPIGKTNMDQFATGLVGTRSPWGACGNAFDAEMISGGSSSGSAVAVALGLASFSLGTDTAGSGRVPAMLNNLYGHKPSRGLLSMTGVVPACRSLDCPSIFALSANDAHLVFNTAAHFDSGDSYARQQPFDNKRRAFGLPQSNAKIAIPNAQNLTFFGNTDAENLFNEAVEKWAQLGAQITVIDINPLLEAAKLLYAGPWVAERYAALETLIKDRPEVIHPVVHDIVMQAETKTAVETFQYEYKMQAYRAVAKELFSNFDFLCTPTAPTTYSIAEVLENPIELNSNIGFYTNYMNLLDLCGTAIPAGFMSNGQPFGLTLVAPAMQDQKLLSYAHQWQHSLQTASGTFSTPPQLPELPPVNFSPDLEIAVCGAHLSGMPLNWQLTERGATLSRATTTSANYRLYSLAGGPPQRPGLVRDEQHGSEIEIEVWSLPCAEVGSFLGGIPAPLGLGKLETNEGQWVTGFICEPYAIETATDITEMGSWRVFQNT